MNFFTEISEGMSIAWDAIRANKMRSILTTLGIVIGIVTVTLMGAAIDGLNRSFHDSISIMGADVLYINRLSWVDHSYEDWTRDNKRRMITLHQVEKLQKEMPMVNAVVPVVESGRFVRYKDRAATIVTVFGTTDQFLVTSGFSIAQGRFMSEGESAGGRPVCIIGYEVATNLFENESPLGKKITISHRKLEVIGVLAKQGSILGMISLDNEIIMPLTQVLARYWREPDFGIQVKVADLDQVPTVKEELRGLFRKIRHVAPGDPDDFSINQQEDVVATFNKVAGTIAAVGLLVTGMSLFVGGIGIMNIMFVSVAERTREIGVRKALGARRRTVLLQFLIEAAAICLIGGAVGLVITFVAVQFLTGIFPIRMSVPVIALSILVALLTGVISGFLPAWRAARMNPVDALRNE